MSNLEGLATMYEHHGRYFPELSRTPGFPRAARERNVARPTTSAVPQQGQVSAGRRVGKMPR
jgi:hypothetical protein